MQKEQLESIQYYQELINKVDQLFIDIKKEYSSEINCVEKCRDCCSNVFNISIIEGFYLTKGLKTLHPEDIAKIKQNILSVKELLQKQNNKELIACPLLINDLCILYHYRPIICRTFGMPMMNEQTGEIATCAKNFTGHRETEQTLRTISSKLLSTQTVILSQYLLRERGQEIQEDYIPPLCSILELLEYQFQHL
jgi:Fe-S-cluster containining protein